MVIALVYGYFAAVTMHLTPMQFQFKVNEKQIKLHKNAAILNNIRNIYATQLRNESFLRKKFSPEHRIREEAREYLMVK